jgi:hypothetical protein
MVIGPFCHFLLIDAAIEIYTSPGSGRRNGKLHAERAAVDGAAGVHDGGWFDWLG